MESCSTIRKRKRCSPNATTSSANGIAVDSRVEAGISPGVEDVDTFKFFAPRAPRDIPVLEIRPRSPLPTLDWSLSDVEGNLDNYSATLVPGLTAIGPDKRTIGFPHDSKGPGSTFRCGRCSSGRPATTRCGRDGCCAIAQHPLSR